MVLTMMCIILLVACSAAYPSNEKLPPEELPVKITATQAKEIIAGGDAIVLDVRSPEEFAQGYIEGAISMPVDEIEALVPALITDKNQVILVYCRAGNRSNIAALALSDMGFTQVFDFGGILDWYGVIVE